jgi:FdhD protein
MTKAAKGITYTEVRGGSWRQVEGGVISEMPVSITVNGEIWLTLMCTPADLEALAVGFLFNEGFLQSKEEIASVRVCPTGDNVDVWLNHSVERPTHWRRTTGCTGGTTSIAEPINTNPSLTLASEKHVNGFVITPAQVQALTTLLFESQDLYRQVGGVHNSGLSDGRQILISAEDIGRHNTLDKISGRCLLEGVHPAHKILLTTGRISSDMMQKAMRMGASILISRTSPTTLSIDLAETAGVTLIGYARRDHFTIYTHPERIAQAESSFPVLIPEEEKENLQTQ